MSKVLGKLLLLSVCLKSVNADLMTASFEPGLRNFCPSH